MSTREPKGLPRPTPRSRSPRPTPPSGRPRSGPRSGSPRLRLPAVERRSTILNAAGQLFGRRGYDGTTLDDVAAAAGVTKPIVYRHFGSKQGVYLAVLERHRHDLPVFSEALPPGDVGIGALEAVLDLWLNYVEARSYAWRMLFWDTGGGDEIDAFRRLVRAQAREVLAALICAYAEDPVPAEEVEPLAELMRMGMASLVLWWLEHPGTSRAAILGALTRVWSRLLVALDGA